VNNALRRLWQSRPPRERVVIAALAAALGAASYLALLHLAGRGREQLHASVAALRTQSVLLEQQAAEHARLRAAPAAPASPTDLRTLVRARTDAAGLAGALARIDAADADEVRVAFGAVSFSDWLRWAADLQAQQVRIDAARIEALAAPGMVGASATLVRSKGP